MQVGDTITFRPSAWEGKTEFANGMICPKTVEGKVVYVHKRGLFCVAEAQVDGQTIRESLLLNRGKPRGT